MQRPVSVAQETESACLGAGMLAAEAMSGTSVRYKPDDEGTERYDKLCGVYKEICPSPRQIFPKLAEALK